MKLKNNTANEVLAKFKNIIINNNLIGKINGIIETQVYFCDSGKLRQKPLIENMNGEFRKLFPKGTDFNNVNQ